MVLITDSYKQYYLYGSMLNATQRTNTVTKHPTVEGTSFSDHIYREPDTVSFSLSVSEISKSFIYEFYVDDAGTRVERSLTFEEVHALLKRWFSGVRVTITTLRFVFPNQVLQSYSWTDGDLKLFKPTLSFTEAKVQSLRVGVVMNPEQYYQAAYGNSVSVGNSVTVQSEVDFMDVLGATASGAAMGALVGSFIPIVGTGVGALIGGGLGFLGSLGAI